MEFPVAASHSLSFQQIKAGSTGLFPGAAVMAYAVPCSDAESTVVVSGPNGCIGSAWTCLLLRRAVTIAITWILWCCKRMETIKETECRGQKMRKLCGVFHQGLVKEQSK